MVLENSLIMNTKKTVAVHFYLIQTSTPEIENTNFSKSTKFLGSILDSNLSFKDEIDQICHKLSSSMFAILNLKKELPRKELITCYYSLVYSIISYNIIIWGQSVEVNRVFILQKRVLRIIFDLGYIESCRQCFRENSILTLTSIYVYKLSSYIFKMRSSLKHHENIHNYPTRYKNNIYIDKFNTSKYKVSPLCAGSYVFNKLPKEITTENNYTKFRKSLKSFLQKNCFYSIQEFFDSFENVT